ncbi:MAG: trypsin-like peptidase domain-containing protein, partial [Rhodothermales bacterium]
SQNNKTHGGFATALVPGETTTLEYYEPAAVSQAGRLHVSTVVHGSDVLLTGASAPSILSTAAPAMADPPVDQCRIDTACSQGAGWSQEISSVVHISNGCTGVLVNNTNQDEKPYVLTVNHCGSPTVGQTLNWTFDFNYESATCGGSAPGSAPSVSGAIVRAASAGGQDFALLELQEPVPAGIHFSGWTIEDHTPSNGMIIGHPLGLIKKLSVIDNPITNYPGTTIFWQARVDHGTIESGSSGSPMFNDAHQLIGLVRAATSIDHNFCSGPGQDDNNSEIISAKLSYIWGAGVSNYLDPSGTVTSLPPMQGSGAGGPSSIWINEVDADTKAGSENDEFIEIVGPPGTDLNGYEVEVYTCSGGAATLQSSHTISSFTLQNVYENFGIFVMGGPGFDSGLRDQTFSGSGTSVLPDGTGLIVLKDDGGTEVFDYQYDGGSTCPASRTTRSAGDPQGSGTMGFTLSSNPSSSDLGSNGLSASPGAQNSDGGQVLPVELVSFEALLDGQAVELFWETASETNNAGFEIQHRPGTAGSAGDWNVLSFVEGYGTTLEPQHYSYLAPALEPGTHRFRLKQIDFDGTFEYSPEVEVALEVPGAFHLSPAYPNPFNPQTQFSLSVAQAQRVQVEVYDVVGRRVATLFDGFMEASSSRSMVFEAGHLPSGLYLIRALGERFVTSQTVTMLK